MIKSIVGATGAHITQEAGGWYCVTTWVRLHGGGRHAETEFSHLTWQEAIDTVQAMMECQRPGWELGDGWRQPSIFD